MPQVLGKVTSALDVPRGPDVLHRIAVPGDWLEKGVCIELELPRHLTCAACEGGGCDRCERSGAITLRGRKEPSEIVEVTLPRRPQQDDAPASSKRSVVIRIPDRGGLGADGEDVPRGLLLLSVFEGDAADPSVMRARPSLEPAAPEVAPPPVHMPVPPPASSAVRWLALGVALFLVLLVLARLLGWG